MVGLEVGLVVIRFDSDLDQNKNRQFENNSPCDDSGEWLELGWNLARLGTLVGQCCLNVSASDLNSESARSD